MLRARRLYVCLAFALAAVGCDSDHGERAVLLLFESGSTLSAYEQDRAQRAARAYLALPRTEQVGVAHYAEQLMVDVRFGRPATAVQAAIARLPTGGAEGHLHDALFDAAGLFEATDADVRAIVLFSSGRDRASAVLLEDAAAELRQHNVLLFAFALSERGAPALRRQCKLVGGAYFEAAELQSVASAVAEIDRQLAELANRPRESLPQEVAIAIVAVLLIALAVVIFLLAQSRRERRRRSTGPRTRTRDPSQSKRPRTGRPLPRATPPTPVPSPRASSPRGRSKPVLSTPTPSTPTPSTPTPSTPGPETLASSKPAAPEPETLASSKPAAPERTPEPERTPPPRAIDPGATLLHDGLTESEPWIPLEEGEGDVTRPVSRSEGAFRPAAADASAGEGLSTAPTAPADRAPSSERTVGAPRSVLPSPVPFHGGDAPSGPIEHKPTRAVAAPRSLKDFDDMSSSGELTPVSPPPPAESGPPPVDATDLLNERGVLVVRNGASRGEVLKLVTQGETFIGRAPSNDIVLSDRAVSSTHMVLRSDGRVYSVKDLGSANGTFVNEKRVREEMFLAPGDILRLGRVEMVFEMRERD